MPFRRCGWICVVGLNLALTCVAESADCPQLSGTSSRNNVSLEKDLPAQWNVGQFDESTGAWQRDGTKNVRWVARLGSQTYGSPVVASGKVLCATNNGAGYLKQYPATTDLGCLLCFQEDDGKFAWQLSAPKLAAGRAVDWPDQGICAAPLIEKDRAWIVTNRCEVVCVAMEGREGEAKTLWRFDMIQELGVQPHNMSSCSVTAIGDLLLVNTSNAVDESHDKVPGQQAASFIALDKATGKLQWADASPGGNILHGQWSSPAAAVIGGVPQALFAGGDGWVYSFRAQPSQTGKPELLWKFDCNPKLSVWKHDGRGDRAILVATPVIAGEQVYIATGEDPEFGEGPGRLWCIDATRRGDVSPEVVMDKDGKPAPIRRRVQAADPKLGDTVRPNPNSAALWNYTGFDANSDGKFDFTESMHRTLGMAAVKDGLVVIADLAGLVHCLDAKTGKVHWTHDMLSAVWGTPLVADGKIYLGDEDGDVAVFEFSTKLKLLAKNAVGGAVYTSVTAANGTLYVATRSHLLAIGLEK